MHHSKDLNGRFIDKERRKNLKPERKDRDIDVKEIR